MTLTNCNKFILPQGRSDGRGSNKETVAEEEDESRVENKTVGEFSHCWLVSRNPRLHVVQIISQQFNAMTSEQVTTIQANTRVLTVVLSKQNCTFLPIFNELTSALFYIFS